MNKDIRLIDSVITLIKEKARADNSNKFEYYLILTLEIIRFEIVFTGEISDITGKAISQLFVFQTHEFYHRDYPELYDKCSELFGVLINYNKKLLSHELYPVGIKDKSWIRYFKDSITKLILSSKPNNK